ncbi:hypothetical protein HDF16_003601 [Granulicella aggregans]|uniref:Uncharacterized protein n=1 Tax=Granulicella aggregans TaxID=474949 RepID=A0A7W8E4B6_9BACT|nr:hypothetical protein [Granulicella aggregans]MBB5058878.1 hypothetical protein [Granulicella aggregans]
MYSKLRNLTMPSLFLAAISFSAAALGQQIAQTLPNAPDFPAATEPAYSTSAGPSDETTVQQDQTPIQAATTPAHPAHQDGQTKRILGIIPNFRSVSANQHLPPQSIKEKFITASQDSFDYSSIVVPALLAGYNQARNQTPEFHQGAVGYGRYLWHSTLDQTSENYFVEFIVPAIAHEDTRYYTLGDGGFSKRALYAIKHVVITRDDAGKDVFNAGEVLGSGMAAALSNAYYPSPERTFGNTAEQWGTSVGIDAFTFAFREFWPDINHKLFHGSKE